MASGDVLRERGARPDRLGPQLGTILLAARGERSRRELAAEVGVSPTTLAELETGRANPTLAYLERIGDAYGIRIELTVANSA